MLELTRYITSQVLDQRKMIGNKIPNLRALARGEKPEGAQEDGKYGNIHADDKIQNQASINVLFKVIYK